MADETRELADALGDVTRQRIPSTLSGGIATQGEWALGIGVSTTRSLIEDGDFTEIESITDRPRITVRVRLGPWVLRGTWYPPYTHVTSHRTIPWPMPGEIGRIEGVRFIESGGFPPLVERK